MHPKPYQSHHQNPWGSGHFLPTHDYRLPHPWPWPPSSPTGTHMKAGVCAHGYRHIACSGNDLHQVASLIALHFLFVCFHFGGTEPDTDSCSWATSSWTSWSLSAGVTDTPPFSQDLNSGLPPGTADILPTEPFLRCPSPSAAKDLLCSQTSL